MIGSAADFMRILMCLTNGGEWHGTRLLNAARWQGTNLLPQNEACSRVFGLNDNRCRAMNHFAAVHFLGDFFGANTYVWGGALGTLYIVDPTRKFSLVIYCQMIPGNMGPPVRHLALLTYKLVFPFLNLPPDEERRLDDDAFTTFNHSTPGSVREYNVEKSKNVVPPGKWVNHESVP